MNARWELHSVISGRSEVRAEIVFHFLFYFVVHECSCVCRYMRKGGIHGRLHIHVRMEARGQPQMAFPRGSLTDLRPLIQVGWLVSELERASCLCLLCARITSILPHAQ